MLAVRLKWALALCLLGALGCGGCGDVAPVTSTTTGPQGGGGATTTTTSMGGSGGDGGGGECTDASQCDDGVDCTTDSCEDGACKHAADDGICDDGTFCNGAETCDEKNGCQAGADPCDDGVDCTTDSCDEDAESCQSDVDDLACDDGVFCNGAEKCDGLNGCAAGADPCDDGVACTTDSCDEDADSCANAPDDKQCDDGLYCTGVEKCDALLGCQTGPNPCDDGVGCTTDTCDEQSQSCQSGPDDKACDDGIFCNGAEKCDAQNDCQPGKNPCDDNAPCTVDSCDEQNDACLNTPNDKFCDDGLFCTGQEFCNIITLQCDTTGTPSCDDQVPCTTDFCDANSDACKSVAVNAKCDDQKFCNGVETCDAKNGCQPGTPPTCDDNVPCTTDACDGQQDKCVFTPSDSACDDGQFCNGAEKCDAVLGCKQGTPVVCNDGLDCTSDSCDEVNDTCAAAPNDGFCDDGLFCNGGEKCDPNAPPPGKGCTAGTPVSCAGDQIACTDDTCDENPQGCSSKPNDANCQQGEQCLPALDPGCQTPPCSGCVPATPCTMDAQCDDNDDCNGKETCDQQFKICQKGTPVDCNDNIACTVDSCNPQGGTCNNAPNHPACDDGFVCNGSETCVPNQGCVAGTPVDCNDNIACTADTCEEPGNCKHAPQNQACDDTVFCNGAEICDDQQGCLPGTPPTCNDNVACTVDSCNANLDQCVHKTDNNACACGESCDPQLGCGNYCKVTECQGKVYQCGDCLDNDNDCDIDTDDSDCLGPCDNNEDGYALEIPGGNKNPCSQDCYYDADSGNGNDDCFWDHKCDPLEVSPNYDPEGKKCEYNPNTSFPGGKSCTDVMQTQSQTCMNVCGPLTPNGCDCFGCCHVPGLNYDIWLGSADANGNPTCTSQTLTDPAKCRPCTIVQACLDPCDNCEICIGKPTLPPECGCQQCAPNQQMCGPPCGTPCGFGYFCNSGCCELAL